MKVTVNAASAMIADVSRSGNRPKGLLYISNGYRREASEQLSALARVARQASVTIFALDPRAVPGSPYANERSPASRNSLRAIAEPTRGFALLDETDFVDGMTRIRRAAAATVR